MDLMNLLRSIEALLYEVTSWLVFYPLTLWRCICHPIRMMIYAERELSDPPAEQFDDALSPPLFLFLTILLAHLVDIEFGKNTPILSGPFQDVRNLLLFRAILFSLFPLLVGIQRVRQQEKPLTRANLRPPFYSQCYVAAPFVLTVDLAGSLSGQGPAANMVAGAVFVTGLGWYIAVLTAWFAHTGNAGYVRALARALVTVVLGIVTLIGIGLLAVMGSLF